MESIEMELKYCILLQYLHLSLSQQEIMITLWLQYFEWAAFWRRAASYTSNKKWMQIVLKIAYLRAVLYVTEFRTPNIPITEATNH